MKKITILPLLLLFSMWSFGQYCAPVFPNGCTSDNIDDFTILSASFSHLGTGCSTTQYGDFTADGTLNISLSAGVGYDFTATHGYGSQLLRIWIDFDGNNVFDDPGELVASASSAGTGSGATFTNGTISIPAGATQGTTRMRIATRFNTAPIPCNTAGYGEAQDYTVNILPPPSCLAPSNLNATNITATTVDLGWTENGTATVWDIEWGADGFTPSGTPTTAGVTSNPYPLTGLTGSTSYDFYVRADCGSGSLSTWSGPYSFVTACVSIAAPWLDDVESHTSTTSLGDSQCWSTSSQSTFDWNITGDGTTPSSLTGSTSANSGTKYFYVEATSGATGDEAYLVSPVININALTDPALSFYYHMYGADMGALYIDVHDGTTWTNGVASIIGQQQTSETDPWLQQIVNLTGYTGNIQVRFRAVRGADYTSDISIDDIGINEAPSCFDPTNLTATIFNATTADLGWTENGTATTWDIEWGPAGFTPTGTPTIAGTTSNPYPLTGLTAQTSYDFYVRADCGVDGLSNWSGPYTFTTPCLAIVAPWTENFENAGSIPNCWSQGASNAKDWEFANTPGSNHIGNNGTIVGATASGGYFAWVDDSSPHQLGTTLESPFIDVSGLTVPLLTFYLISDNEGDPNGNVTFSVDVWDGSVWNEEVYLSNSNTLNGGWEKMEVYLSSLTITGPIKLRFIVDETNGSGFDDDVALDDVSVVEAPACPDPSLLTATNITATSADLGWQENGSATAWDIEYGPTGFTPTGTPSVSVTTNPYTLPGLTPVTQYEFYVRADCAASGTSNWAGPFTFQTQCTAQLSGTYTIGATGDYATFTDAVFDLNNCGISGPVTFNVLTGSGPYNEQVIINEIVGASATNTITFNGNGETLTSTTTTDDRSLILLDGADYVTINNLNLVTISDTNNFVIQLTNNADFNTINGNTINMTSTFTSTSTSNAGIVVSGSLTSATSTTGSPGSDNTFTNNTIIGGYYGLTINGESSANNSLNNVVSNNVLQDFRLYGMYLRSISNATITNNDISQPTRTNTSTFYGIYFTTSGENNLVEANKIHGAHTGDPGSTSSAYGIYHSGVDATVGNANTVVNNLIYDMYGNGTIYAIYNSSSDGVHYYHNTISLDNPNATGGTTRGVYQTTTASDIEFINNIITITRGGTGTKYALYYNTSTSTIVSNYNVLYVNAPAGTNGTGYYSTTGYTTLASWQTTANGGIYDNASIDADPLYVNSLGGDFTPSNSAVNNIGTAVGVLTDINGNPRDAVTPDPGAYEFTPPACPQPSDLIATNITATTADLGWTENGTSTTWDIELGPAGFTPTEIPTTAGVMTNPYTQGGLTELTEYDFYVRADCGGGDLSVWVGPYTFTTGCSAPLAGVYTIDAGGTGDYVSLNEAASSLAICGISAPVTFNVVTGSGPYNEQIVIPEIVGVSAVNTITFNGNGETLTSITTSGSRSLILLDGADYVTIANFNLVTISDTNNFVIQLTNNADFNTVDDSVIDLSSAMSSTSSTNAGIVVSGSLTSYTSTTGNAGTNNTFTNNTITGGHAGIAISGGSSISNSNIVENNVINDNYSYGIYFRSVSNSSASHNSMSRPVRNNTTTYSGLYFVTAGENNMIASNRIFNTHGGMTGNSSSTYLIYHSGVDATIGNENWVVNNLIYDIKNDGTLYGIYNSSSDGVFYYHNTIALDDPDATGGTTRGIYQTTTATGIEIKNNIISITRGGTGTKYALYFNATGSTIASNNNVLYVNAAAGTNGTGYYSTGFTTLADWQTANGGIYDNASVDGNPLFANILAGDYAPTNPAVDNIGTPVGVLEDINSSLRSTTTPDAGAYEFTPPSCLQPSALTATNITITSADLGWTEVGTATTWDIEWGVEGFTPSGTPTIAGTTNNPQPITGLSGNTSYDFYVRADCGVDGFSSWSGPYTFTTECNAVVAPWTENFENGGSIPDCWKQGVTNAENWLFANTGAGQHIGNNGTMLGSTASGGYFAWVDDSADHNLETTLESPFIDVSTLIEPRLSFYLISDNEGDASGNVTFSVDVWDGAAWVPEVYLSNSNTLNGGWELIEVSLTSLNITGDIKLRFIVDETNGTGFDDDVAIDDVSVYEGFVCDDPSALTASNLTTSSADLVWTENGTATTWDIEWGTAGFTPTGTPTIAGVTTNPYTLTGLTHDTMYEFYVRADCGGGLTSNWVGPFTFETLQIVCDVPTALTVNTVTDTTVDISWTASASETGGYDWSLFNAGDNPSTATPVMTGTVATGVTTASLTGLTPTTSYDFYVATLCDQGVVSNAVMVTFTTDTPPCDAPTALTIGTVTDTTVDISWTASATETGGYNWAVFNAGDNPSTGTPVATGSVATGITTVIVSGLTAATSYDFYVATVCNAGAISNTEMITFTTAAPPCDAPTALTVATVTSTTVDISWTASATETGGYNWAVFNAGDNPSTGTPVATGSVATGITTVVVSGLTAATSYDFYVATVCNAGAISDAAGPLNFTTQTLGAPDNLISGFKFYPNPVKDIIYISATETMERVVIYNLLGQQLKDLEIDNTSYQVNISELSTGVYLMQVTANNKTGTYRVIKR